MDKEIIFYLIFLAIALLSRLLKKKPEKKAGPPTSQSPRKPRPKSFEDLLEEITSGQQKDVHEERHTPSASPLNKRFSERKELADQNDTPAYPEAALNKELKTIDELVDIDEVQTKTRLAETLPDEEEGLDIRGMLMDPEDIRKAVILSEILPRKY